MNKNNLIWMDLEMTGLDPENDRILELAVIATDADLHIVAEGPVIAVHQSEEILSAMDEWNVTTHTKSGLIQRVRNSRVTEETCQEQVLSFMEKYVEPGVSPLCGNSIWQDRRFIARYLPRVDKFLLHRNIDVSSVKELFKRWSSLPPFEKKNCHEALSDIRESIAELAYYRKCFFLLDNKNCAK